MASRFAWQLGQKYRHLQENASRYSCAQSSQRPAQVDLVEQLLRDQTVIAKPAALLTLTVRDPDDAWVLASAVAGGADLLVSGDQDLLVLANRAPCQSCRRGRRGNGCAATVPYNDACCRRPRY